MNSASRTDQQNGLPQKGRSKGILRLAGPLVISFWIRDAFQLIDLPFASLLGEGSVAAIGLTQPLSFLLVACWVGASSGLTARLSQAMGSGEDERVDQLKLASRRIMAVLITVFAALGLAIWFGAEHLGLEPEVAGPFRIYASVFLISRAATGFWSILPDSLVKAHHDTQGTMWAGLISGAMNAVLNSLFVLGFGWGIMGIALASAMASLGGLLFAIHRARGHERRRQAAIHESRPGVFERPVRAILSISVPAGLAFVLMAIEGLIINGLLARTDEATASLAAWTAFDRGLRFLAMPLIATGVAMLPLAARLWGAGDVAQIRRELRIAFGVGALYVLLFVFPVCFGGGRLIVEALFDDPRAIELGMLGTRWLPWAVPAIGPFFILRSTFDGLQKPLPGLIASIARTLLLVGPLVWLGLRFASDLGQPEVAGAYAGLVVGAGLAASWLGWQVFRFLRA